MKQRENNGSHPKEGQSARNSVIAGNYGIKGHNKLGILEWI